MHLELFVLISFIFTIVEETFQIVTSLIIKSTLLIGRVLTCRFFHRYGTHRHGTPIDVPCQEARQLFLYHFYYVQNARTFWLCFAIDFFFEFFALNVEIGTVSLLTQVPKQIFALEFFSNWRFAV